MTVKNNNPFSAALRKLEVILPLRQRKRSTGATPTMGSATTAHRRGRRFGRKLWFGFKRQLPFLRKLAIGTAAVAGVAAIVVMGLLWRLSSGPIALDLATPWLTAAIEQNFGNRHRVEVGGTVLERDAKGHPALRLRDIVVRDSDGEMVASAPRAEVGVSGASLLLGSPRVASFLLIDANMEIRVEPDGHINVYVGGKRPFVTISPISTAPQLNSLPAPDQSNTFSLTALAERGIEKNIAALLGWVDGLGALGRDGTAMHVTGFDGYDLIEVGVKNGSMIVDDARNGRQWAFKEITLSLTRPEQGGVAFNVGSESEERPWSLSVALMPSRDGRRSLSVQANQVMLDDLLLVLQLGDGQFHSELPISADVRAVIAPDGTPEALRGRILASGHIGDEKDSDDRIAVDRAEFKLDWDIARRTLLMPFDLVSGGNRITLLAQLAPPPQPDGSWMFALHGGSIVLGPIAPDKDALVLKRVAVRIRHDLAKKRIELDQADFGTDDVKNVGLALSGNFDYSGAEPQLTLGFAGAQMSVSALKRIWPALIAPKVRSWAMQHVFSGTVERVDVAINAPVSTLPASGPPLPENGLAVDLVISGATLRPVDGLPVIRDADVTARITGRTATVTLGRGNAEISPGRRLVVSNGVFEVPDMYPKAPPARVRFRLDGPVAAAAELMANERLRDFSGALFDPATSRGTLAAQAALSLPLQHDVPKGSVGYNINIDLSNFTAERMLMGQKVEAAMLRISATNQAYQLKGDVKINGTPAQLEYRKTQDEADAEVRIQAALDEPARARLGFDLGGAVSGLIPIKLVGRIPANERDSRFAVEADLTAAKIDNLLSGWVKPAGRPARAAFVLIYREKSTRLEEIFIDGSGATVRGNIELDAANEILSANFPIFGLSEGDKTTLKVDRGPDGALRVSMRGDVFDGRSFIKTSIAGATPDQKQKTQRDIDLDIRMSAVLGHHGETLRGVDLRLSRRDGRMRSFTLNAKLGRDTPLKGDLRDVRDITDQRFRNNGGQMLYFDTNDAGSLFRFTDTYPRMIGGRMLVLMDPPSVDQMPQEGILNVRDFAIRGEPGLEGVVANTQGAPRDNVAFTYMNAEFTRTPGKLAIRDGVVRGPIIGATIDGNIDYQRDEVHLRGTFVPLYGLNNMFPRIPIIGFFLGGGNSNSGLFGVTYEVVGSTGQPLLRVNPASALAPGLLRKFFEFPANSDSPQELAR